MIRVEGIHKSFGKVRAVRGVSFEAPDGKITGLLGPNGAGKSTTLRVLYTVLQPDEGRAFIDGADVVTESLEARRRIGALPHGAGLYPHLTARENIAYYARLCGIEPAAIEERVDPPLQLRTQRPLPREIDRAHAHQADRQRRVAPLQHEDVRRAARGDESVGATRRCCGRRARAGRHCRGAKRPRAFRRPVRAGPLGQSEDL